MVSQMKKSYPYRFATENLSQRAYDFIRDKIVDQKYRPGEPIVAQIEGIFGWLEKKSWQKESALVKNKNM